MSDALRAQLLAIRASAAAMIASVDAGLAALDATAPATVAGACPHAGTDAITTIARMGGAADVQFCIACNREIAMEAS